ncbi:MAG: hypothetical protein H6713_25545 [Myxococcales bacterium]|nr:hypothetical protein [Myxococcales bacterium]
MSQEPREERVAPAPAAEPPLARQLEARAVYHDDFARGVVYTWTTAEQVEALRASRALLVATSTTHGRPSPFNRALARLAEDAEGPGAAIARALVEDPQLQRRRYAWTSPYATTLGLAARRYGDALVAVELDSSAYVLRFMPYEDAPLAAVDLRGVAVPLSEVAAHPERLGAVYHARDGPRAAIAFREYVLCNPAMIASWSLATPALAELVAEERAMLRRLREGPFAGLPTPAVRAASAPAWRAVVDAPNLIERWRASLAFDNERYQPSPENLAAIERALAGYDGRGPPLIVTRAPLRGAPPAPR